MTLTPRQKLALCATVRCGFSQADLADALGLSKQAVNQLLARAKSTLLEAREKAATIALREAIDALLN